MLPFEDLTWMLWVVIMAFHASHLRSSRRGDGENTSVFAVLFLCYDPGMAKKKRIRFPEHLNDWTSEHFAAKFRDILKETRTKAKMTQQEVAEAIKNNASYICDIERGRREGVNISTVFHLAKALGVSPARLIPDIEPRPDATHNK